MAAVTLVTALAFGAAPALAQVALAPTGGPMPPGAGGAAVDPPPPEVLDTFPGLSAWTEVAELPGEAHEAQGTILTCNDKPYLIVFGGFRAGLETTYESFKRDLTDDGSVWEKIEDMPHSSGHPLTHMAQTVVGSKIYLAGGYLGAHPGPSVKDVFSYDCESDSWEILPELPGPRAGAGMVYIEELNVLVFAGGGDRITNGNTPRSGIVKHIDYGTTWIMDLADTKAGWTELPITMPDPRNHQGGVTSCGRHYWIGGQHEENEDTGNRVTNNELLVDLDGEASFQWGGLADLPKPLGHISASTMPYKCGIVVIAGVTQKLERSDSVYYWHPVKDEWKEIGAYPLALATPVCGITGDYIHCAGGGDAGKKKAFFAKLET